MRPGTARAARVREEGARRASSCEPESDTAFCQRLEKNCDEVANLDNCGERRTVACGACQTPRTCGGGGVRNVCGGGDPARCGDGHRDGAEACDGSELGASSCQSLGFRSGLLRCTGTCQLDSSGCTGAPSSCGDGVLATTEACEGFELRGKSCQSEGFYSGRLVCSSSCRLDTSGCTGRCGDGQVNGPETCDDGRTTGVTGAAPRPVW